MSDNTPTLADFAARMRRLVEEDVRIAADLRELAKEMRECGHRPVVIKAIVKALVLAEDYDNPKPLESLKERAQDVAMYGAALGIEIDGFGSNRNVVNDFADPAPDIIQRGVAVLQSLADRVEPTPHDTDGVVIEPAGTNTSAAIPGGAESRPSEPSPDAAPPADASTSGQSGQALDMPDIPGFLRRDATNRAPWMEAAG